MIARTKYRKLIKLARRQLLKTGSSRVAERRVQRAAARILPATLRKRWEHAGDLALQATFDAAANFGILDTERSEIDAERVLWILSAPEGRTDFSSTPVRVHGWSGPAKGFCTLDANYDVGDSLPDDVDEDESTDRLNQWTREIWQQLKRGQTSGTVHAGRMGQFWWKLSRRSA